MDRPHIHFDFETRSTKDLKHCGPEVYAKDPYTDVLCMAYCFDDGPIELWKLGDPAPVDLLMAVDSGASMIAHNAAFEHAIWTHVCVKKYGWPPLLLEQLYCTMTFAYSMGLPGSLENAAKALGLTQEKDMAGNRVMLQLARPRFFDKDGKPHFWHEDQESSEKKKEWVRDKYRAMYEYCVQDVEVERLVYERCLVLSPIERETWLLDQKINNRGVQVDIESAKKAIAMIELEKRILDKEMQDVSNGRIASTSAVSQIKLYLEEEGLGKIDSIDKASLEALLSRKDLAPDCRKVLELRKRGSKTSTSKLQAMIKGASDDGRVRGCFQYYGAPSTGRWAGRRIQLHNLPRPTLKQRDINNIFEILGRAELD